MNIMHEQQRELFINAIEKIKNLEYVKSVKLRFIDEWVIENGIEKGAIGFPLHIKIEYEIPSIGDMCLYLQNNDERTKFEGLEILSIDVKKFHRLKGYGIKLIEQAKIVMKTFGVCLYGDYMNEDSKEFYIHCGFTIDEKKRQFRMECN